MFQILNLLSNNPGLVGFIYLADLYVKNDFLTSNLIAMTGTVRLRSRKRFASITSTRKRECRI